MKKLFLFATAVLMLTACKEDGQETGPVIPREINILLEDDIVIGRKETVGLEFVVSPADAVFRYDVSDPACQLSLEYAPETPEEGGTPLQYVLSGVEKLDNGHYRAMITDFGTNIQYDETIVLAVKGGLAGQGAYKLISRPFGIRKEDLPYFTDISFLKKHNNEAVYEDINFKISDFEAEVSSPLISSPLLVASFECPDAKVYVKGVEQVSGETVNDFSKPVTYTVKGKSEYEFTVKVGYSGLPSVFIETGGKAVPPKWDPWLEGTSIKILNNDWTVALDVPTSIRGRGNSTWNYPKKPYALKLDSKAEVLGMPAHRRWVLLANWMDRTLLRNDVAFKLSSMTGLDYTPRGEFVEVFINGKHEGNYYLCEHIKVDKNRVDIDELDEGETDGGYVMELDVYYDEVNKFMSEIKGLPYMFKDPDEVDEQQFAFLQEYVNNLERALYDDERFAAGEYKEYVDLESFVDWWLVMELTGNYEPNHPKSCYMYKDKGGRLTMGPVWDFDWGTFTSSEWYAVNECLYYGRLFQDPSFVSLVKERWSLLEENFRSLPDYILGRAEQISASEAMNHEMWPITAVVNMDEELTFKAAVNRMTDMYQSKLEWLDSQLSD